MTNQDFKKIKDITSSERYSDMLKVTKDLSGNDLIQAIAIFSSKQGLHHIPITGRQFEELFSNKIITVIEVPISNESDLKDWDWTVTTALELPGAHIVGTRFSKMKVAVNDDSLVIGEEKAPLAYGRTELTAFCSYRMGKAHDSDKFMTAIVAYVPIYNEGELCSCYLIFRQNTKAREIIGVAGRANKFVSQDGQIFSFPENKDKPDNEKGNVPKSQNLKHPSHSGQLGQYLTVFIGKSPKRVHREVAKAFVPNDDPLNKTDCCHRNGNSLDNRAENLEWGTSEYNIKYSVIQNAIEKAVPDVDIDEIVDDLRKATMDIVAYEKGHDKRDTEKYKMQEVAELAVKAKKYKK